MKLRPVHIGQRYFNERPVTVTDPGYDDDVWCKIDNVKLKPGVYNCIAWKGRYYYTDENGKRHSYQRVFCCGIYLDGVGIPNREKMEEIGFIGVDAGLAGFFQDKPNYTDEQWQSLCNEMYDKDALIVDEGFFTSSGYGDGEYPVFAYKNGAGEIAALEINF